MKDLLLLVSSTLPVLACLGNCYPMQDASNCQSNIFDQPLFVVLFVIASPATLFLSTSS